MIDKNNFKALLVHLGFEEKNNIYTKHFYSGCFLAADFNKQILQYPESEGLKVNERQTCNFSSAENAVVFECVHKLLEKGYKPKHLELEPKWKVGHGASGGRADILVKNQKEKPLLIIECKTYEKEFDKAWKETLNDGGQLFSYAQQISATEFLCLYASKYDTEQSQLRVKQRIISHKDNEKVLELGENLKSYRKATNVKNRYEVWKNTYQLEYTETGIFEDNIQPYQIGKNHYTLETDTRAITETDKEGKYNRFRTILRQHNIARRETAFEVLVNLFLAKIVDEEENKNNLEFYWKGVAYDNYYDFIDRLQKLYQIGMRKFLKDEVMYISSEQIDGAFWTVKNRKNATRKQIQKYFRDLKFFSNNAFSLINVHNERLFNRNTKVLVELVQMWQGLRLKTSGQNQFLGDMFEYFLDNSIKQSEGQFFTPLPITKFIVSSLPLEDKIQQASEPLKAIDYACGAGHFLTEYAHQIRPIVKKHKQTDISHYYKNTIGIEKEDRLAKIAKVSAYMYGQDDIKIIEEDALSHIDEIKPESFDVLVANPPFAVEGFLLNLTDRQKETYELIKTTELNSNTNNIQCFFLERAKQIMAGSGVVGVIVPSSILSNSDGTHIATREVILKYFDIIALVELGSGTFGKTGTNTVVLFLRRKNKKPEPAEHYQNRVDDYFSQSLSEQSSDIAEYQDINLVKAYCLHIEVNYNDYIKLFGVTPENISNIDALLKTELFAEYKKQFENSAEVKNLKKKKFFKAKTPQDQQNELNKRFIRYLYTIEKDKLFYFMLAYENPQKVLIIKSPTNNKEKKQFLGYEWSNAKGQEGIKYHGGTTVNDIITPLLNPRDFSDNSKINYLIRQNFLGNPPGDLSKFEAFKNLINYANLQDILDFSRTEFNKAFSLTPKKNIVIESKWELVKLGDVVDVKGGNGFPEKFQGKKKGIPFFKVSDMNNPQNIPIMTIANHYVEENILIKEIKAHIFDANTVIFPKVGKAIDTNKKRILGLKASIDNNVMGMISKNQDTLAPKYLFEYFNNFIYLPDIASSANPPSISATNLNKAKIPLPPKSIQEEIVSECEAIDQMVEQAQKTIERAKGDIENGFVETHLKATRTLKLSSSELFDISIGKRVIAREIEQTKKGIPVFSANVFEPFGYINKDILKDFSRASVIWGIDGDWMVNYIKENCPFYPTDHCGVLRVKGDDVNPRYLAWLLDKAGQAVHFSRTHRASIDRIKGLSVKVPSIEEQNKLVATIEKLEQKITLAQKAIASAPQQKQAILDKYLK